MRQYLRKRGKKVMIKLESTQDIGNTVLCDMCNKDWTNSKISGGFLFGSNAVCPDCSDRIRASALHYNELSYIKAECPKDMSFKDWVVSLRCGDNTIKTYTFDNIDDLKGM